MVVYRYSNLFQLTTVAQNPNVASAHMAGWSEGFWLNANPSTQMPALRNVAQARAAFLPKQAAIVGYRIQSYDISGNKLTPIGSTAGSYRFGGSPRWDCDQPQVTLRASGSTAGGPNAAALYMRGIPDDWVAQGEYAPFDDTNTLLQFYYDRLIAVAAGFIGRNLSVGGQRVFNIADNGPGAGSVINMQGPIAGLALGDFVRFVRVVADNKAPVEGTFAVSNINVNAITVRGLQGVVLTRPSGTCRKDSLTFLAWNRIETKRITTKRVGAPFEKYRGRRSKQRK